MIRALPNLMLVVIASTVAMGCGDKMGTVKGKLMFEGKPVTAGSVQFVPKVPDDQLIAGRSSSGPPDENGEFQLSTHARNDGALIGTHNVFYQAPTPADSSDPEAFARQRDRFQKFGHLRLPPGKIVEVKSGVNNITLELERIP